MLKTKNSLLLFLVCLICLGGFLYFKSNQDNSILSGKLDLKNKPVENNICTELNLLTSLINEVDKNKVEANFQNLATKCSSLNQIISGKFINLHLDNFETQTVGSYYGLLTEGGEYLTLAPISPFGEEIPSSSEISIKGLKTANYLFFQPNYSLTNNTISGLKIVERYLKLRPVEGEIKTLAILGYFQDETKPSKPTIEDVQNDLAQMDEYYRENSYGKISAFTAIKDVDSNGNLYHGDVRGWYQIPTAKNCNYLDTITYLIKKANEEVNIKDYNTIVTIFSVNSEIKKTINPCMWSGGSTLGVLPITVPNGIVSLSVTWVSIPDPNIGSSASIEMISTYLHETGHTFGISHAMFFDCKNIVLPFLPTLNDPSICTISSYGDQLDSMGSSGNKGLFNPVFKDLLSWFNPSNLKTLTPDVGTYTFEIEPLETASNELKAVKLYINSSSFLTISYRQPIGFDSPKYYKNNGELRLAYQPEFNGDELYNGAELHLLQPGPFPATFVVDPTIPADMFKHFLLEGQSVDLLIENGLHATITTKENRRDNEKPENSKLVVEIKIYRLSESN